MRRPRARADWRAGANYGSKVPQKYLRHEAGALTARTRVGEGVRGCMHHHLLAFSRALGTHWGRPSQPSHDDMYIFIVREYS